MRKTIEDMDAESEKVTYILIFLEDEIQMACSNFPQQLKKLTLTLVTNNEDRVRGKTKKTLKKTLRNLS